MSDDFKGDLNGDFFGDLDAVVITRDFDGENIAEGVLLYLFCKFSKKN